ncbi:response regulator transcription factor [Streptomyces sp. NY05-11A]|uniref:response regulator transcription factor n=1 Tax=Streptomyces soliscabiei TaxID=588897 RepID=UPI0029B10FAE|nr:helix-turn-helix transcriptional regulator [Streptomyces sp. NY05-11A]
MAGGGAGRPGATNEQIARKLFITVSTVERHLTRAYRKLGIRRRTQLPSCLSELVP